MKKLINNIFFNKNTRVLKKNFAKFLMSSLFGKLIRTYHKNQIIFNDAIINCNSKFIKNETVASLYFGAYESAEVRAIKKYIRKDLPILEFGSSIGVLTTLIAQRTTNKIFSYEANPDLITIAQQNIELNNIHNSIIANAAIINSNNMGVQHFFHKGKNTTIGFISNNKDNDGVEIETLTLKQILLKNNINDYILICDIEGAELPILLNDKIDLNVCQQIIIEVHEITYRNKHYQIDEYIPIFLELGFEVINRDDNVFVLNRIVI